MTEKQRLEHITRENVLHAIERIDLEGIPSNRTSDKVDLVFNGVAYPPKYVLSLSGYFSDRKQFVLASFFGGGNDSIGVNILRDLGFEVLLKKDTIGMQIPKEVKDVHLKYCFRVLDEKLNKEKFQTYFETYLNYCNRTHWLERDEAFKFRFGRWMQDNIDLDKMTDKEVLDICIGSQDQAFGNDGTKGVYFIVSSKRYQDEFISLKDIQLLRKLHKGEMLESGDLKGSPLSFTKFAVWAGVLAPKDYKVLGNSDLGDALKFLFDIETKFPATGIRNFNWVNACLKDVCAEIKENYSEKLLELTQKIFGENTKLREVDINWFAQDLVLFLDRRVFNREVNYYFANHQDEIEKVKELGLLVCPVGFQHYYQRMTQLKEGDRVLHYFDGKLKARSTVEREYQIGKHPYADLQGDFYTVQIKYEELGTPIDLEDMKSSLDGKFNVLPKTHSPLNKDLDVYPSNFLSPFTEKAYRLLLNEPNYWVFQGNPDRYDFQKAIKTGDLDEFTVSSHRHLIQKGDKVILWITGENSGVYALAEVSKDPYERTLVDDENWIDEDKSEYKAGIELKDIFTNEPILKSEVDKVPELVNLKVGLQGSNFLATKEQYETIKNMRMGHTQEDMDYWVYSPGENARFWESFYSEGVMGLGWNELGDTSRFNSKEEIAEELRRIENTSSSKKNDATANWEFMHRIKVGDMIIAKRGRQELLGYGIVTSDYIYDESRTDQKKYRKVDWKLKGNWPIDHFLSLKTLTWISDYESELPEIEFYYQRLLADMGVDVPKLKVKKDPINQIFYGPPGTGKTYHLKKELFPVYTSTKSAVTREEYLTEIVKDLPWWKVIAQVLYDVKNAKVNDIYEHELLHIKVKLSNSKTVKQTIWGSLQEHTVMDCPYVNVNEKYRQNPLVFEKDKDSNWKFNDEGLEQINDELIETKKRMDDFRSLDNIEIQRYEFVTFHQSYSYEDFIEGIKPVMSESNDGELKYTIEDGVFKRLCFRAKNDPDNHYAIFIDEINRGNVSAIFGELITLIEPDKRLGEKNEMQAILPYSRERFGVPNNLHVFGTMNTADRSVEALDTALRRRFKFQERMPDASLLDDLKIEGIDLAELLDVINQRIEMLIDRDHMIGHAYLISVNSFKDLKLAFKDKIIPLLQEYFYGDYGKIGLVLGSGFVDAVVKDGSVLSSFNYEGRESLGQMSYELKPFEEVDFKEALKLLFD